MHLTWVSNCIRYLVIASSLNWGLTFLGPYGGSKAAIDMIGETLRLELAPFDVKVITCVTGAIQTNIMTNSEKHDLPSGSLYAPVAEKIYERARGDDIKDQRSSSEDFAERLVRDVLGGATGKVYRGKFSSLTRFTTTFLPTSILVSVDSVNAA